MVQKVKYAPRYRQVSDAQLSSLIPGTIISGLGEDLNLRPGDSNLCDVQAYHAVQRADEMLNLGYFRLLSGDVVIHVVIVHGY